MLLDLLLQGPKGALNCGLGLSPNVCMDLYVKLSVFIQHVSAYVLCFPILLCLMVFYQLVAANSKPNSNYDSKNSCCPR